MAENKPIIAALIAARAEMETPNKTAENPHFRNKYAPLDELIRVTQPALQKHGLMLVQFPVVIDGKPALHSTILSADGEAMELGDFLLPEGASPQNMGSALTYWERYTRAAIFGLAAEEDDDANAAESDHARPAAPSKPAAPAARRMVGAERKALEADFFEAWKDTRTYEQNADKDDWKARGAAVKSILRLDRFPKLGEMSDEQVQTCIAEWRGGLF